MEKKVDLDHQPLTVWIEDKEIKKEEKNLEGNKGKRGCRRRKEGKDLRNTLEKRRKKRR